MGWLKNIKSGWQLRQYLQKLERYPYPQLYRQLGFKTTNNEYLLQTQHFNRGRQYVKSFGLLGLSFEKLIGRAITTQELTRIVLLSHFAPVYDDLFDKLQTPKERMVALITNPSTDPKMKKKRYFCCFTDHFLQKWKKRAVFDLFSKINRSARREQKANDKRNPCRRYIENYCR